MPIVSCLPEETPIIRWTYPGEPQQQLEADEYDFIGLREYAEWYVRYKRSATSSEEGIAYFIYDGEPVAEIWRASDNRTMIAVKGWSPQFAEDYTGTYPPYYEEIKTAKPGFIPIGANKIIYPDAVIVRHEKRQFIDWVRVGGDVTFVVKNQGEIVFSRTDNEIPQVQTDCIGQDDQCPENTCEVDCHTHICCYGSDGIAVHSFDKP